MSTSYTVTDTVILMFDQERGLRAKRYLDGKRRTSMVYKFTEQDAANGRSWLDELEAESKRLDGRAYWTRENDDVERFMSRLMYHQGQLIEMAQDSRDGTAQRLRESLVVEVTERQRLEKQVKELQETGTLLVEEKRKAELELKAANETNTDLANRLRDTRAAFDRVECELREVISTRVSYSNAFKVDDCACRCTVEYDKKPGPIAIKVGQHWRHKDWTYPQKVTKVWDSATVEFDGGAVCHPSGVIWSPPGRFFTESDGMRLVEK